MSVSTNRPPVPISIRTARGQVDKRMLITLGAAVIIVLALVYLLYPEPLQEPVPAPATGPARPLETVEPAQTEAERGDTARDIIDRLSDTDGEVDYDAALSRALEFQADGRLADAQLLIFFAARGGHAPAAFTLATYYDPNHHAETTSLMEEADPFQAYRWYRVARDAGQPDAEQRLANLRRWTEDAAASGSTEAERLLLQWEN